MKSYPATKLSATMIRGLRYLYASESRNSQGRLPTRTALALQRRGLIIARFNPRSGYDCDLTEQGRRAAREL